MFRNGRLLKRQVKSVPKILCSSSAVVKKNEQSYIYKLIPPRINRTPTEILKALSCTVKRDPTAFHYHIPDDPFFYPQSNQQKKRRLLALESGRKSARWIIQNNPGFFNHNLAEPSIKTFLNKPIFDENAEVSEETLLGLIYDRSVSDAIAVYKLLENKGIDVSKDAKQSLLELVCFYNSSENPDEKDLWGRWYEVDREKTHVWENEAFAKTLFDNLEPECPLAYSALIQGMLKHNNLEEAMELFAAGVEKKIKFTVGVYNLIIENIPQLIKDPFKRFDALEGYLKQMAKQNLKPNVGTLNSVLRAISNFDEMPLPKKESFVCKLLAEFHNLKIYPSLGGYYYILKIFADQYEMPQIKLEVARNVMDTVRNRRWTVEHASDFSFFRFSMGLFCLRLESLKLAQTLFKIYSEHDHHKFLNSNYQEFQFFDQYLFLTFSKDDIEQSMKVYRDLVPSQTFLDSRRYLSIIKFLIRKKKFEYLEEIWKDMNQYLSKQFPKMYGVIGFLVKSVSLLKRDETPKFFYEAAEVLFNLLDTAELEPETLEAMLIVFTRFEDEKKILFLLNFILEKQNLFINEIHLSETFMFGLSKKNIPLIKLCLELKYHENSPNLKRMVEKALPLLDEADQSWLNPILKKVDEENKKGAAGKPAKDPSKV